MLDLKLNGFDCSYTTDSDGGYIINSVDMFKPMVEKVIQAPKPVVESDPSIISKIRNLHADSIVMHVQALELQASTEEIVRSVDDMEERVKSSVTSAFGLEVEPVEEILITDEDIKEVVESKKACYQPSEEEKEELKELAEEVMSNLGIEKGIHTLDFVEFLETRMPKQEVRGYLRGKAIECLFEEDYHSAVICIEYFLDNGYVEVEA